jgi:L-lactate utilization protein LutC
MFLTHQVASLKTGIRNARINSEIEKLRAFHASQVVCRVNVLRSEEEEDRDALLSHLATTKLDLANVSTAMEDERQLTAQLRREIAKLQAPTAMASSSSSTVNPHHSLYPI